MREIVLASGSKRRSEILSSCGIAHIVHVSKIDEIFDSGKPVSEVVETNAVLKTESVARETENAIVVGADTLVVSGEKIIGKPKNESEAKKTLSEFSGRTIKVYTGICVVDTVNNEKAVGFDMSEVVVEHLDENKIQKYFPLLGPYDKAGGFSIEGVGSMLFDNIKGSYFNVLGLSMRTLKNLFMEIGLDILDYVTGGNE